LEKIKIQLWRNSAEQNWSVQLNDKHYDSVTLSFVEHFVALGLSNAKKALIEGSSGVQSERPSQ
jgi:hypothetical protein